MRWIVVVMAVAACAGQVSQDRTTGPDGVIEGATSIALVDGVARAEGSISYPAGDRVDWYDVALPRRGDVDVEVAWKGKRVGVELWDDDYVRVMADRPGPAVQRHVRGEALVKHAFVRLYAPGLEDAGTYTLTVRYTPGPPEIDWANEDIPPPPPFPMHVEPVCDVFDAKNPACRGKCNPDAPDDACRVCPSPPDVDHPACQATMPCPNPPDRRVRACVRPRCTGPNCLDVERVLGRIIKVDAVDAGVIVVIALGTEQGVAKNWHALILAGDSDQPLAGGELAIVRVDKRLTVARTRLTKPAIEANPRVRLAP